MVVLGFVGGVMVLGFGVFVVGYVFRWVVGVMVFVLCSVN